MRGGGNAHDRAKHRASQRLESHVTEAVLARIPLASPPPAPSGTWNKLREFWTSTPVWGVLGVLATLVLSPISTTALYGLCWLVLCFEFARLRVLANDPFRRRTANVVFAVLLGLSFLAAWPILPKPKEQPNIDRSLAVASDTIVSKIGAVIDQHDKVSNPNVASPPSDSSIEAIKPKPDLHIRMASVSPTGAPGQYSIAFNVENGPGADIDNAFYSVDYFIAERRALAPLQSVMFRRYAKEENLMLLLNKDTLLRQNNAATFTIPLPAIRTNNLSFLSGLMAQEGDILKLAGLRVRINYERYLDRKRFDSQESYQIMSTDGYRTISGLFPKAEYFSDPTQKTRVSLEQIEPYLSDTRKWRDDVIAVSPGKVEFKRDFAGLPTPP